MAEPAATDKLLFEGSEWTFDAIRRTYDAIEAVALEDLGLDLYPNQIEIISAEQMLDAYSSSGMPLMYGHWSFGKKFIFHESRYSRGLGGLAYEIVINSNPCVSYCLDENTMAMQALVMAHAACGHNHFFKNNHLFRQWTDPEGIIDYLDYAREFIRRCEEKHGSAEVEELLDAAHALMPTSVFRHRRPPQRSRRAEQQLRRRRQEEEERAVHYIWSGLERSRGKEDAQDLAQERRRKMRLPEENLLYFIEKASPILRPWQRELVRIVRNIAQYFYPQKQTKVMNEGCATFVHHYIMNELYNRGQISEGAIMEFLHSHSSVVFQPEFDDPRYSGINPYALGFAMMEDIKRICEDPKPEDREWFPEIAGSGDWRNVLKDAWANYRDESFILQYLSPTVMRHFRMFAIGDDSEESHVEIAAIHDDQGFRRVRQSLSAMYDLGMHEPNIQVVGADLESDRTLRLRHTVHNGRKLNEKTAAAVLTHIETLWGYEVTMEEEDA